MEQTESFVEIDGSHDSSSAEEINVDDLDLTEDRDTNFKHRLSLNSSISPINRDDDEDCHQEQEIRTHHIRLESDDDDYLTMQDNLHHLDQLSAFSRVTPMKTGTGGSMLSPSDVTHSTPRQQQEGHQKFPYNHQNHLHMQHHEKNVQEHQPQEYPHDPQHVHQMQLLSKQSEIPQDAEKFLPVRFQRLNAYLPFLNPRLSMTNHIMGLSKVAPGLTPPMPSYKSSANEEFLDLTSRKGAELDDTAQTRSSKSSSSQSSPKSVGEMSPLKQFEHHQDREHSGRWNSSGNSTSREDSYENDRDYESLPPRVPTLRHNIAGYHPLHIPPSYHHQEPSSSLRNHHVYHQHHLRNDQQRQPLSRVHDSQMQAAMFGGFQGNRANMVSSLLGSRVPFVPNGFHSISRPNPSAAFVHVQSVGGRPRDPSKPPACKKYKCDVCGKAFSRSNTLVTHKRIHTGEKPFACDTCGRAFRQPGNLTRHKLTHTTVKPYICPRCRKAFNRASNLHTHMRTHTSYKPFSCTYCGKGFHQKIDMKMHMYTHATPTNKLHRCKLCGETFKLQSHLEFHWRTHPESTVMNTAARDEPIDQSDVEIDSVPGNSQPDALRLRHALDEHRVAATVTAS